MENSKTRRFILAGGATLICAFLGNYLGGLPYLNMVGALVLSLLLGMLLQIQPRIKANAKTEIGWISNKFLRLGIILLGFKLNLIDLAAAGVKTILLALIIVTGTVSLTYWIGRRLGVEPELAILAASGTGICGAAAVMGISPQIQVPPAQQERQRENEVLAVAIVAIMGTIFALTEIALKPLLHLTPLQFGVLTGGSLHEIAHAVAAGSAGGAVSLNTAIITKLSRVLMLAPAAFVIGFWYQHHNQHQTGATTGKLPIPWFMAGFILASVIGTFVPFNPAILNGLVKLAYLVLGMAMAALGISVNFKVIFNRGGKAFLASFLASICLLCFVLIVSRTFF